MLLVSFIGSLSLYNKEIVALNLPSLDHFITLCTSTMYKQLQRILTSPHMEDFSCLLSTLSPKPALFMLDLFWDGVTKTQYSKWTQTMLMSSSTIFLYILSPSCLGIKIWDWAGFLSCEKTTYIIKDRELPINEANIWY